MADIARSPFSWDSPDESLLEDRRGGLPAFPPDVFSRELSEWLSRSSRGAGTLLDHVAVPMLGVTSSLIGKARRVQASTPWIEPMTCWTCVVAQSGDRKTPGLKVTTRALDRIEADNAPVYASMKRKHLARVENAKAQMKRWRKECEKAVAGGRAPPRMPIEAVDPGDFIYPSLYVTDSTVPKLAKLCVVRPRGMLQIRDELSALFDSLKSSGSGSFYLESWNGDRHIVERVDGTRSVVVENLLIGLVGGFQPDKIARAFAGDEDGMYGRFLFGWPATPAYSPLTDDINEVDPAFQGLLTKLIRSLRKMRKATSVHAQSRFHRRLGKNSRAIGVSSIGPREVLRGVSSNGWLKVKPMSCAWPVLSRSWIGRVSLQAQVWKASPQP